MNSSATLFGFDLYQNYFNKDATELETVKAGKRFGLGLALVALIIAPFIANAPDGLFAYIQESLGSLSVPILAVVLIGIYTRRVPALGAKIVMIGGVLMYLISQFVIAPIMVDAALAEAASNGITDTKALSVIKAEAYPHFLHVMGILFVINIGIMLLVGKLRPQTTDYIEMTTDQIDVTPWKHALLAGAVITIMVLGTYFIF